MTCLAWALPFDFEKPAWLWLALLVPVLIVASLRSLAGLDPVRRVLAIVFRSLLVVLVACCLAGIERVRRNDDLTVLFLMDRSYSVQSMQKYQEEYIHDASQKIRAEDRVGLIDFARNAYLEQLPMRGGYFIQPGRLPAMPDTERTDIASAIRLSMAMFPHDTAKRMVLMSDGNDNMGDVLTEARRAKADGIPIDVVPLRYEHRNEVYFERIIAPTYAELGEQVTVRMVVGSYRRASGTLNVYQNERLVEMSPERSHVELAPGSNTFMVKFSVDTPGVQTYKAVFQPDDDSMDTIPLNNTAGAFSFVAGSSPALLITADPQHDAPLVDALRSEKVNIDMKAAADLGDFGLLQMMTYSSIILANIPAQTFTDQQQQDLVTYVKDMGSGLIMLGGHESFGAGGWIGSPVEEVMPVSFEIKHKRVIPRGALVLIVHSCEVDRGNFWAKEMAKKSVDTISSQDYIGVLAYSYSPGGANWEVPLGLNTNKAAVKAKIDRMQNGDMPDFGTMMEMAYRELAAGLGKDAAQKHVIILSDGDPQGPSPKLLDNYVEAKITVSTIGIGWGAHVMEPTLMNIATTTGGRYYPARNPRQLPQIFVKESQVVRRPLIVDEPFQPRVLHASSELLGGIEAGREQLPKLGGLVLTSAKTNPNVLMPIVRMTDDGEDPVLAHWQYELGKTVAFTSGDWPLWGEAWTQWPKFAKFWAQIVRWTMRQEAPANFDTHTRIEGNRGRITVEALDKDASFLNNLQMRTNLIGPDGQPTALRFSQTGPGHYEAEFDVEKAGQYLSNVQVFDRGKSAGTIRTGLTVPFSPEYRDLIPNEALLHQVADITGGRWLDVPAPQANVFSHDLPPSEAKRAAWDWVLAWLLLPAFLLDVSVRRLASWLALSIAVEVVLLVVLLFGMGLRYSPWWGVLGAFALAELVGWAIRFRSIGPLFEWMTDTVTALAHAGDRSAASLEKLKDTRERVRDELASDAGVTPRRVADEAAPIPLASGKRRFDVGDAQAGKPVGDLQDALGGAKAAEPSAKPPKPARPPAEGDAVGDEDVTSRLLRAKKRAKKDMDDKK
jgi:uncharacterized membrane protein/Mg-chelatase subunit ChlD